MEKQDLKGYVEFFSCLVNSKLNADFQDLIRAADQTQIHTFGWPVGVVMHNVDQYRPKPSSQDTIRAVIETDRHFDFWTLSKSGNYYILSKLFEDQRSDTHAIYLDTRTIRTAETFLRTANLYKALGVAGDTNMACRIEFGGLEGRVLTAANHLRAFTMLERKCSLDTIQKEFQGTIDEFRDRTFIKEKVFETIKSITEMCDFFVPSKEQVTDVLVDNYLDGKIV